MRCSDIGKVHSIQTLGTLDGPGVRFVVFLQGCNLRCSCCHNPDTWGVEGGREMSATELAERAVRYKEYFGHEGGVTVSGGEPLIQAEFVRAFFAECKKRGITTCLDTSGSILGEQTKALLDVTDRVLLDIKYPSGELYREHVGCSFENPLAFLDLLAERGIPTTLRQVIIPTLTDNEESVRYLVELKGSHPCVDKIELLPFRKICQVKYDKLGISFKFAHLPEPSHEKLAKLQALIKE